MGFRSLLAGASGVALLSGCTVVSVGAENGPPRVESKGLIEGHAAVGIRDEDDLLRVRVLDGESDGALGEIVVWKLFRLEIGALGVGIGIGPFDFALGAFFYEPEVPTMIGTKDKTEKTSARTSAQHADDDCELCRKAKAQAQAQAQKD